MKPLFSIITPVYVGDEKREQDLLRAVESIKNQTFIDFEHIVINDGSPRAFELPRYDWLRVISKPHQERVVATNLGLKRARGEWICLLDSDDEFVPEYLSRVKKMIDENLEYKMFNFGCKYVHKDGNITQRDPFEPKKLEIGHEVFGGGNIVNGTFVFSREVYKDLGGFPPAIIKDIDCTEINYPPFKGAEKPYIRDLSMATPFDFAAYYLLKYPEIRKFFMVDHEAEPDKILKELGNPWGQDAILFYQYTRKYHSFPFKEYLYLVHPK